jgi:ribonuclease P protein component
MRIPGACFLAFCLDRGTSEGPRVGFTVPRSAGKAVERNRIKRRMREAVRLQLSKLAPQWDVVFNARRAVLEAPFEELKREVDRVFRRCKAS